MTTKINKVNDAKFQATDLNFIVKMEPDKLIIETFSTNDEVQYVGEILANPLIDLEAIEEMLEQKNFKIIIRTEEILKIKIGPFPLEMIQKKKVEANKLRRLQESLRDSLHKQGDLQQTVNSQKDQIILLKGQISSLKTTVSEVKSNQNAFESAVHRVKDQIVKVQAQFQLALDSKQTSISQQNNRVRIQLQDQIGKLKTKLSDLKEKVKNTEENSRADRKKYERMIQSQKDLNTRQNGVITGLRNDVQELVQRNKKVQQKLMEQGLYQKLYQHLEQTISKEEDYYGSQSQKYYNKAVSNQEVEEETIKYINYLKQNIKPFPPQHNEQLFFLIDLFDSQNKCIINSYHIDSYYEDSPGPAKFYLGFDKIQQRIDLKQFLSFNNWNNLVTLSFQCCGWFNDDDWRALVEHAANFSNLKGLNLYQNKISAIKEGEIEQFKSLERIYLYNNPLSGQSKQVLKNIQKKNNKIRIFL